MNCAQAEKRIYLYQELTLREQKETELHIATCAKCQAMMERVMNERILIGKIRHLPSPVQDHSEITRRVMSKVLKTQETKWRVLDLFSLLLSGRPVRYAMAALSLLLVVTFAIEYSFGDGSQKITKRYPRNLQKHVELNSSSFHETLLTEKDKEQTASRTQAVYACLVRCLHTADPDCAECGNKFSKSN
jgi:hypothetical protein